MPAEEEKKSDSTLKTLLEWEALARPFKAHSREYFSTIMAIAFLLIVIALFLKEWFLIMVIIALVFVHYVMSTVKPEKVSHRITNKGITTGDKFYAWEELTKFWFSVKWGEKILNLQLAAHFPGVLMLLLGEREQAQIEEVISKYLTLEEPQATWMDKATTWLSEKIPLEKTN